MSLTMKSRRRSINFTYGGFMRCRTRIANLVGQEVGAHYEELKQAFQIPANERKAFWDIYDKETDRLIQEGKLPIELDDFLYASDAGGTLSPGVVQKVLDTILKTKSINRDDVVYGRPDDPEVATWASFQTVLWDCVFDNTPLKWN